MPAFIGDYGRTWDVQHLSRRPKPGCGGLLIYIQGQSRHSVRSHRQHPQGNLV